VEKILERKRTGTDDHMDPRGTESQVLAGGRDKTLGKRVFGCEEKRRV